MFSRDVRAGVSAGSEEAVLIDFERGSESFEVFFACERAVCIGSVASSDPRLRAHLILIVEVFPHSIPLRNGERSFFEFDCWFPNIRDIDRIIPISLVIP